MDASPDRVARIQAEWRRERPEIFRPEPRALRDVANRPERPRAANLDESPAALLRERFDVVKTEP